VVCLVQPLVDERVVQAAVNPVDEKVGKADEERELQPVVPPAGPVGRRIVYLGVATHFEQEEWHREEGHPVERRDGLLNLEANLVAEVLWMLECRLVEDKDV
jgi:hypothetical protein